MTITAFPSPVVTFPASPLSGDPQGQNPEAGPSAFVHGLALLDPRAPYTYLPGQDFGKQTSGWNATRCEVLNQTASIKQTNNIALVQTATANTALTLTAGTGVTGSVSIVRADTGATVTGLLALDSAMTTVAFGSARTMQLWDPTKAMSRNVRIGITGDDTTGSYLVSGFDIYGFPLTEKITPSNATGGTFSGAKAFKYIRSVVPSGTVSSTSTVVGTGDIVGLPLRADRWGQVDIAVADAKLTAATGFTAAVTSTATATTGDVRGTYSLQSASNGTFTVQMFVTVPTANLANTSGLLGVTQA